MEANFWHQRWENNQIGFHEAQGNVELKQYFSTLALAPASRVFVPLCGKTQDIRWLLAQGCQVVAVELSEMAIEALFAELNTEPQRVIIDDYLHYSAENIDVFVGDFFTLTRNQLGNVDAIYDRAALVALPEAMRLDYTVHLRKICANAPQLLLSFEYQQDKLTGPPFSVTGTAIQAYYAKYYKIAALQQALIPGGLKGKVEALQTLWLLN